MSVQPPHVSPSDDELRLHLMSGVPDVSLAFQAIVDLNRGVVAGYEVLARFDGPLDASPDRWLAAANKMGRARAIETAIWHAAFEAGISLPGDTFLSINATPDFLASTECATLLGSRATLEGVVIEVTEHEAITDYDRLSASLSQYRRRGAAIAVDDAGAGYASMSHVLALRPEFIKLDRAIVTDCDHDPAKAALVEMVGSFAGRIDSWLIAEGVEREGELATLLRMNVSLGQGYFLAKPQAGWAGPEPAVTRFLGQKAMQRMAHATVGSLSESVPAALNQEAALDIFGRDDHVDIVILVDEWRRPLALARREGPGMQVGTSIMRVSCVSNIRDVLLRAMTREETSRFDPVACIEEDGSLEGVLRIEHLVAHLARGMEPDQEAA